MLLRENHQGFQLIVELLYAHHRAGASLVSSSKVTDLHRSSAATTGDNLVQEHFTLFCAHRHSFCIAHGPQGAQLLAPPWGVTRRREGVRGGDGHITFKLSTVPEFHNSILATRDKDAAIISCVNLDHWHAALMRVLVERGQEHPLRSPWRMMRTRAALCLHAHSLEAILRCARAPPASIQRRCSPFTASRHSCRIGGRIRGFTKVQILG
mmetsp:Transcript_55422/g.161833  ORF Transcript_55422/g.161833 Transcript_55422/m.161833 type:complete len:210 (-) Transcript_55422:3575-4204(-)